MSSGKSTAPPSSDGGGSSLVTPSTALLNRRLGTSPAPRMLTPYELALLQQSAEEIAAVTREMLVKEVAEDRKR